VSRSRMTCDNGMSVAFDERGSDKIEVKVRPPIESEVG
jgi:hypothetical protein